MIRAKLLNTNLQRTRSAALVVSRSLLTAIHIGLSGHGQSFPAGRASTSCERKEFAGPYDYRLENASPALPTPAQLERLPRAPASDILRGPPNRPHAARRHRF